MPHSVSIRRVGGTAQGRPLQIRQVVGAHRVRPAKKANLSAGGRGPPLRVVMPDFDFMLNISLQKNMKSRANIL